MKIGFVLDDRLDVPDGVQQYVRTLGGWLERHGHQVHYLVASGEAKSTNRIHYLGQTVGLRFNKNRVRVPLPASPKRLRQLLARERFDVLHVQMPYAPWLSGRVIATADTSTAVVGTFHVVLDSKAAAVFSRALQPFYKTTARRFDQVCAVSAPAEKFMQTSVGLNGIIIPNAVETARFRRGTKLPQFADGKQNIVFLGRLVERKGAAHLLRAFAVMANPARYRLILVGDGPLRSKLESLCRQLGIERSVHFQGFVDEAEKPNYLASADVAVFPATGGESFGIVLIEALAAGAGVVLGGDNPGYRSVLGEQPQSLVDPTNTIAFANRLTELSSSHRQRHLLHSAQQRLVKKYSIDTVGPQIIDMYKQALQHHKKMT